MRRLLIILSIMVAAAPFSAGKNRGEAAVTCMSFNIRFITPKDQGDRSWATRRDAIVEMFARVKPDVVGIQEQSKESVDYLASRLPEYEFYVPDYKEGITLPKGFSMVIFYRRDKFSLLDCGRFFLSETPRQVSKGWDSNHYRTTAWVRLKDKATGRKFYCFNTHLDHRGPSAKENGVLLNVQMMRRIAGKRSSVVLMGDMNIVRGGSQDHLLVPYFDSMLSAGETAQQSRNIPTYNGYSADKRTHRLIDYIFYRNAEADSYYVIDGEDYGVRFISDHYPIMTSFRI